MNVARYIHAGYRSLKKGIIARYEERYRAGRINALIMNQYMHQIHPAGCSRGIRQRNIPARVR